MPGSFQIFEVDQSSPPLSRHHEPAKVFQDPSSRQVRPPSGFMRHGTLISHMGATNGDRAMLDRAGVMRNTSHAAFSGPPLTSACRKKLDGHEHPAESTSVGTGQGHGLQDLANMQNRQSIDSGRIPRVVVQGFSDYISICYSDRNANAIEWYNKS